MTIWRHRTSTPPVCTITQELINSMQTLVDYNYAFPSHRDHLWTVGHHVQHLRLGWRSSSYRQPEHDRGLVRD